ncbi:hypothetical protein fHeYen902_098c [Yersinia phage fHe-Yen9-02]|nr:hypothetical protein fHeYen902_098c [Yersinia phage fHe-Yen9-02]
MTIKIDYQQIPVWRVIKSIEYWSDISRDFENEHEVLEQSFSEYTEEEMEALKLKYNDQTIRQEEFMELM